MTTVVYQIQNWDELFENNKSRTVDRCQFVCVPNKQDGMGLTRVLAHKNGRAIYGLWHLMVGACSRQRRPRAGWMTDTGHQTGTAWTLNDLALRWRCQEADISEALEILSSPNIGWIKRFEIECPTSVRSVSARCQVTDIEGKEEKGTEGNEWKEGEGTGNAPRVPEAGNPQLAHIPSEHEFLDEFMNDGIPTDYLRKQWVWFDGNDAWLTRERRLKKWPAIVRQRWAEDRAKWGRNGHADHRAERRGREYPQAIKGRRGLKPLPNERQQP
jgi:hypothetical protein